MNAKRNILRGSLVPVTALIAGGILLAGCTTPTPAPSESQNASTTTTASSPTASASQGTTKSTSAPTVAPPTSETEASAAATAVAKQYWEIEDQIFNDGGTNPDRINTVAAGQAAKDTHAAAAAQVKNKIKIAGERGFEVTQSYSSELTIAGKPAINNGFVGLSVCNDITPIITTNADGTPGDKGTIFRSIISVEVQFDPTARKWFVMSATQPGGVVAC